MPEKHKETNKYKFRSFTERVKNVRVSAIYRAKSDQAIKLAQDGAQSAYLASLAKWAELDLSRPFRAYYAATGRIRGDNYALVVHNQSFLIATLKSHLEPEYLNSNGWLAVPALLELIVALSTDLSTDFNDHFYSIFETLKNLIRKSSDLDLTEAAFTCASQLIKLNSRFLLANLSSVIDIFIDLISDEKREHVRTFAGDAFGYLLRKFSPDKVRPFWLGVIGRIDNDRTSNAIGTLLFQAIRGIKGQVNSRSAEVIQPLLSMDCETSLKIVDFAFSRLFYHLHREHAMPVVEWLLCSTSHRAVHFIETFVRYHNGILVPDVAKFVEFTTKLEDPESQITIISALLESTIPMSRQTREKLLGAMLESLKKDEKLAKKSLMCMRNVIKGNWYTDDYQTFLLNMAVTVIEQSYTLDSELLALLVDYAIKQHTDEVADSIFICDKIYNFNLATVNPKNTMIEYLIKLTHNDDLCWAAATVLSYTYNVPKDKITSLLTLNEIEQKPQKRVNFSALAQLSISVGNNDLNTLLDAIKLVPTDLSLLRSLDYAADKCKFDFDEVYGVIRPNLAHFNRHVRRNTISILAKLSQNAHYYDLVAAERTTPDLPSYREKLNHFRKFIPSKSEQNDVFYLMMFGQLYINFNLIMPEVKRMLIADLERAFESEKGSPLDDIMTALRECISMAKNEVVFENYATISNEHFDLTSYYTPTKAGQNENVDFDAYRNKVWECASSLSYYLEPKSRVLVPIFLNFVADEFAQGLKYQHFGTQLDDGNRHKKKNTSRKMISNCLTLFAKFTNPTKQYREPELNALYNHLLESADVNLQKGALECLLSYKSSPIAKYGSMLKELVDEKSFKSTFKKLFAKEDGIDDETAGVVVKKLDEEPVFDVVYKIAFGKMLSKIASGSAGGGAAGDRQKFVIRNLVNADSTRHLKVFCSLALRLLDQYSIGFDCDVSADQNGYEIIKEKKLVNLDNIMPFGKQLGLLATIQTLLKSVNWSLEDLTDLRRKLLSATVSLGQQASNLISGEQIERAKLQRQIREIRLESIKTVNTYCFALDELHFEKKEINALIGWLGAGIISLSKDAHSTPTPLLKLIRTWCSADGYRDIIYTKINQVSIMEYTVQILATEKASKQTALMVMECVASMVEQEPNPNRDEILAKIMSTMIDYFDLILSRGGSKAHLNTDMLKLVVQFTAEVENVEISNRIAWLLIKQLKSGAQFLLDDMLVALAKTLTNSNENEKLKAELVILTGTLNGHERREKLVACFEHLGDELLYKSLLGLNKTKPHFSDPIDYDVRLITLNDLLKEIDRPEFAFDNMTLWKAVTINVLYMLRHLSDLSIQTLCSRLLTTIMKQLVNAPGQVYDALVHRALLPAIRKMLRAKNEQQRFEFVLLLSKCVQIFAGKGGQMAELASLIDADDVELDFFANVTHLQFHRRQRAFTRAAGFIRDGKLSGRTAERFIMPLAMITMSDRAMKEQTQLLNASMDLIAATAERNSWAAFKRLLDNQLTLALRDVASKSSNYGASKKESKLAQERQEQKELDQKNAIKIIVKLIACLHWPIDQVTDQFRDEIGRLANLNYSDQSIKFDEVESVAHSIKKEEKKEAEKEVELDGEKMEETALIEEEEVEEIEDVEMVESKHSQELLQKVYRYLHLSVRPRLFNLINPPKNIDDEAAQYDERSVRIPVAASLVELLLMLGSGVVRSHAPSVILKLVDLLRSRDFNQREAARKALLGALDKLGSGWFHLFLDELKSGLQRGYQRHVLMATISNLLNNHKFKTGSIDGSVESLSIILNNDLIGDLGRERKVAKLIEKTPEARARNHVIGCYKRLGELIGPGVLNLLLDPLKNALIESVDKNLHEHVYKALTAMAEGIVANDKITGQMTLVLVAKIFAESLKVAKEREAEQKKETYEDKPGAKPQSCLLLSEPKKRQGAKVIRDKLSNRHYLNQFGLLLFQTCLKVAKVKLDDDTVVGHIDGIIDDLINMLVASRHTSEQAKILRIFTRLFKHPDLPSLKDRANLAKLQKEIFSVLKQQCRGTRQNDELVSATFKAVTILINSVYSTLEDTHLRVLLNYAEEDLYSAERQTYAFPLLHALLKRQLRTEEMETIGDKVLKLAVTGDTDASRNCAKTFFISYLMDYPLGETKVERYMIKLLGNLAYQMETGRQSMINCVHQVIQQFPPKLLWPRVALVFSSLAATHSGDDSIALREQAGTSIKVLVEKYPDEVYWTLIAQFMKNSDPEQKRLALLLVSLLIEDHSDKIQLGEMFDEIYELFVEEYSDDSSDAILIALLQAFHQIDQNYDLPKKYPDEYASILARVEKFLVHPHAWARQSATKIIKGALERIEIENVNEKTLNGYWTTTKGRDIALRHIVQLKSAHVEREHMNDNRDVIMYLIKLFYYTESKHESEKKSDLLWLMQKLNSVAAFENSDKPTEVVRREIVVEIFITTMSLFKEKTRHLNVILEVFYREAAASDDSKQTPQELKRAVYKASMIAKSLIGDDLFTTEWESARRQIVARRSERKRNLDQKAVIDPEAFNRMKIKKHEKERTRKKRILEKRKMKEPGSQSKKLKFNSVEKL